MSAGTLRCRHSCHRGVPTTPEVATTESIASESISDLYAAKGAHEVAADSVPGYQLFYPAGLSSDGNRHPVVTFGNGSYATYEEYEALLQHLASWGFVVVVADSSVTGDGTEILGAAQYVVDQNTNAESIFTSGSTPTTLPRSDTPRAPVARSTRQPSPRI
ncbi:hypothetical protein ACETU7_35365 [Rhodococcus sp. 3Y1]